MRAANFDVNELTQYLQGTCKTLEEGITEVYEGMTEDDLTEEDTGQIDSEIFLCGTCGCGVKYLNCREIAMNKLAKIATKTNK